MTNELLATLIGTGEADELQSLLWDKVRGFFILLSNKYVSQHAERCKQCGITVDDIRQESYFAMLDAIRAYCNRPAEQSDYKFLSFCCFPFKNHAGALLGFRSKNKLNEPLNSAVSLNAPVSNGLAGDPEETELIAFIPDEHSEDALNSIDEQDFSRVVRETVREELANDQESLNIIEQRFYENKTFEAIGAASDLTGERIRQIQEAALRRLRKSRKIQLLAGKLNPYYHVGLENFRHNGSIEEQLVERMDEAMRQHMVNRYIHHFDSLDDEALKRDVDMLTALPEASRNSLEEMIEALNLVARQRGLGMVPVRDTGSWW